jgi:hypothetical protein
VDAGQPLYLRTDANDRMARTSKMNMIMHGDGTAAHHHDGFLNVNGILKAASTSSSPTCPSARTSSLRRGA